MYTSKRSDALNFITIYQKFSKNLSRGIITNCFYNRQTSHITSQVKSFCQQNSCVISLRHYSTWSTLTETSPCWLTKTYFTPPKYLVSWLKYTCSRKSLTHHKNFNLFWSQLSVWPLQTLIRGTIKCIVYAILGFKIDSAHFYLETVLSNQTIFTQKYLDTEKQSRSTHSIWP